jgi:tetratricopeptide (TPR) repeat protein
MSLRALRYPVSWPRPFARSVDRDQLRPRVFAFAGLWFFLAGLLAAVGFAAVLILSVAVVLIAGIAAAGVLLVRGYPVRQRWRDGSRSIAGGVRALRNRLGVLRLRHRVQRYARRARGVAADGGRRVATLAGESRKRVSHAARNVSVLSGGSTPESSDADRRREARRLNELGAQLRRRGDHEQAAEQHLAALAIVRELGDRRAEALTLNNLALALVHIGGVAVAVPHFERALAVLREIGDEEHEGQVIANLGFVRRRQGRDEEAESLLHAALDKLTPQSSAYRQVEEQLRRAS